MIEIEDRLTAQTVRRSGRPVDLLAELFRDVQGLDILFGDGTGWIRIPSRPFPDVLDLRVREVADA